MWGHGRGNTGFDYLALWAEDGAGRTIAQAPRPPRGVKILKGVLDQAVSLLDGSADATLDALETLGRDAHRGGAKVNRLCKRAAGNYEAIMRLQREAERAPR